MDRLLDRPRPVDLSRFFDVAEFGDFFFEFGAAFFFLFLLFLEESLAAPAAFGALSFFFDEGPELLPLCFGFFGACFWVFGAKVCRRRFSSASSFLVRRSTSL